MKVLFPIGSFYPAQEGGPSNTIYWLTKGLKKNGVEPIVITTTVGINQEEINRNRWTTIDGIKVIYFDEWILSLPLRLMLRTILKMGGVDIIHLTSLFYPPSLIIATVARLIGKTVVWSPRGELEKSALRFSARKKRYTLKYIKSFLLNNTYFHATSDSEAAAIKSYFGEKIRIASFPNYMELPKKYDVLVDSFFLFVGRLHPIKGLENLLRALSISENFLPSEYAFKIAGKGEENYVQGLKQLVLDLGLVDKVIFLGLIEGNEKQQMYASSAYTFLPSFSENFGNVVVESLAQGTPVVASKGTPWSRLVEENAGFWVDNSAETLANIIDEIIVLDPESYRQQRLAALEYVQKEFDIYDNVEKWVRFYSSIIPTN